MSRYFIACVLILFSLPSQGLEVFSSPDSPKTLTLIYNEDKEWIVQKIGYASDAWPQLIFEKRFQNRHSARSAVLEMGLSLANATSDLPTRDVELKSKTGESLWTVKEQWSVDWENKYSKWVREELSEDWWQRHDVPTDCADVAYSARWIFARIHGLPMANRLASGEWFTHNSVRSSWLKLPTAQEWNKDQRFLAALNYMLNFVFTHSLWSDSYPIRITPDSLVPGVHHLHLHGTSGHTQFVWKTSSRPDEIPVITLNSTVPRKNRTMMPNIFFEQKADKKGIGFQKIRWPVWRNDKVSLVDSAAMPDFSEEQFGDDFISPPRSTFWQEVFFRLNPRLDLKMAYHKTLLQLEEMFLERVRIVEEGYSICKGGKCPQGSALYEDWSTPSRDNRIATTIWTLSNLQWQAGVEDRESRDVLDRVILRQEGLEFTLAQLRTAWNQNWYSSDPNEDPMIRWGLHPLAIANQTIHAIKSGLKERELHLEKPNPCLHGNCALGSTIYRQASSHSIDKSLKLFASRVHTYCSHIPEFCPNLRAELIKQNAFANGQTLDIWAWINEIPFFNSDPRHSPNNRYISQRDARPYFVLHQKYWSQDSMLVYDGRVALVLDPRPMLYRIEGARFRAWTFPSEEPLALDSKTGYIWTISGTTLKLRHVDHPESVKTMELSETWGKALAYGGRLLMKSGHALRLLDGLGDEIKEVESFSGAYFTDRGNGLAMIEGSRDKSEILNLVTGELIQTPFMMWVFDVQKFSDQLIVAKFTGGSDIRCMVIHNKQPVVLGKNDRCLWVDPKSSSAAFLASGPNGKNYIHRVYKDWNIESETNLGAITKSSERLVRLEDGRTFCLKSSGRIALPPTNGLYVDCNDRYHIIQTRDEIRVVDAKTSVPALTSQTGQIEFVSSSPDEHYVFISANQSDLPFAELLDLSQPEHFSLLSQPMDTRWLKTERRNGLQVQTDGVSIWIGD